MVLTIMPLHLSLSCVHPIHSSTVPFVYLIVILVFDGTLITFFRYSLAVSKNDQHALSWTYLGMLAAREGDYARAKDGLDRALALAASQNAESTRQIVTQALEMLDLQEAEIEAAAELEGMGNRVGGECNRGGQEEEEEEEEEEDHDVDGTSGNEDPKVAGEAVNMLLEESACIPLATRAVDRVPASSLTVEQFRERYVWEGLPVVITGDVAAGHAAKKWSPAEIVQHCRADVTATVNRRGAGKWAGQLPHHSVRLADFLAPLRGAGAAKGNAEQSREPKGNGTDYLFDFNLPTMCPALMEQFKMPAYVAQDLLQRTPAGTKYREYWPSLFAGKGGSTGAEMHVDAWCSHFWMVMLSGSKRWTLFSEEDSLRLGRNYFTAGFQINSTSFRHSNDHAQDHAQDGSRGVEPSVCIRASAVRARPMAAALMPLVATLNPGDLLFVPAETPHYVENLSGMHPARNSNRNDDWVTMAISGNFLDESNFECAVDALERLAITDPQTAALVKMLQSPYFDSTIYEPAGNVTGGVPWQLYKEGAF